MTTISSKVTSTVDLGSLADPSPLTVTSSGEIYPAGYTGAVGVYSQVTGVTLTNQGQIYGGAGALNGSIAGGDAVDLTAPATVNNYHNIFGGAGFSTANGGTGVYLFDGTLNNQAIVVGGLANESNGTGGAGAVLHGGTFTNDLDVVGGSVYNGGTGNGGTGVELSASASGTNNNYLKGGYGAGLGGTGASLDSSATLTNSGTVNGGSIKNPLGTFGGTGGVGVSVSSAGSTLTNTSAGHVTGGGTQGSSYSHSQGLGGVGIGGTGVSLSGGTVINHGAITGGNPNDAGNSGEGGSGIEQSGGTLKNYGAITGGAGGSNSKFGNYDFRPNGGAGVDLSGGTFINNGSVTGGQGGSGGAGYTAGNAGTGVTLEANASMTNNGSITGGQGQAGYISGGAGTGVTLAAQSYLTNTGTITGGAFYYNSARPYGGTGAYINNGTLKTSGTISGGSNIDNFGHEHSVQFGGASGILIVENGARFNGAIDGFKYGDTVDIVNLTTDQVKADFNAGTDTIATPNDGTLQFINLTDENLQFLPDADKGTDVSIGARSVISTHVSATVSMGTAQYSSNLTVTGTGAVVPGAPGATAVISHTANASLANYGSIAGGTGTSGGSGGLGVDFSGTSTTLNNYGAISGGQGGSAGTGGTGIDLGAGATLINSNTISGGTGGGGFGQPYGTGGLGLDLRAGSTAINTASISGGNGAYIYNNGGTSGGGIGVYLDGGALTTSGAISGGLNTIYNGSTGRVDALQFGPLDSKLLIESGASFAGDIGGFKAGDTIDLLDVTLTKAKADFNATSYTLSTLHDGTLQFTGNFAGETFVFTADSNAGTDITLVACYLRGTRILTPAGEIAIESLAIGDRVNTMTGGERPIRWIGRRSYKGDFAGGNRDVLPVRIRAGALGDDLPRRDLWVSPEHALYLDGMLIAARDLVNGVSILQEESVEEITYIHLEFDSHAVIYAEGALAESFVDDDSRVQFDNVADYWLRYPEAVCVPARFCAPRVEEGGELEAVRQRLSRRVAQMPPDRALDFSLTGAGTSLCLQTATH